MSNNASSIIGPDLAIAGSIISKGELQIDGKVKGDVHCVSLVLGEKAQITGGVVADDVVVKGRIDGSITGQTISLHAGSHVEGDIHHQSLMIEHGAFFDGVSKRSDTTTAIVNKNQYQWVADDRAIDGYEIKIQPTNAAYPGSRAS